MTEGKGMITLVMLSETKHLSHHILSEFY